MGYKYMKNRYTKEQILSMAAQHGIEDLVRVVVYAAYHVLDPLQCPMEISDYETGLIDWQYAGKELSLIRRYLRSEECADIMERLQRQAAVMIPIARENPDIQHLPYRLEAAVYDEKGRWPVNILEDGGIRHPEQFFDFNITWSPEVLTLSFRPYGEMQWCTNDNYEDYMTHLMLRVGYQYEKTPVNIIFQMNNGIMKAYMDDDNMPWDMRGYEVPKIRCSQTEEAEGIIHVCKVPWHLLGIEKAEEGTRMYLDLQARITTEREKNFIDICWQAGNCGCEWQEVEDCSFLISMVLR